MRKLFSLISFLLVFSSFAFGQLAQIDIPITVVNGTNTAAMRVGLDMTATDGIDVALGEGILPPPPPAGAFDARWDLTNVGTVAGTLKDYRNASFPYTGTKVHYLMWQRATGATAVALDYNVPTGATMTVTDAITGTFYTSGPLTGAGTYTIPSAFAGQNQAWVTMNYTNIMPVINGPVFSATSPLDFGNVNVGTPSTLPLVVTNSGNQPLNISNIVNSNPLFTFVAGTFPIVVAPSATTTVQVTFTPTAVGAQTDNLVFSDDALGNPHTVVLNGNGYVPAPVIGFAPASLDFGAVGVAFSSTLPVTVSNTGDAPLNVTLVASSDPQYTFAPNAFLVPAGGSQVVNVTFAPTAAGTFPATLTFTHNAAGSPSVYNLTGVGNAFAGLTHEEETKTFLEGIVSEDTLQLMALNTPTGLQAMQFTFEVNMGTGDSPVLTLLNIIKGNDVAADPNWVLEYKVFKGTGANYLKDYVKVLLYNVVNGQVLTGANTNYLDLLRIRFRTNNLPTGVDFQTSTIFLKEVLGSDPFGAPVSVAPISKDLLTVTVKNSIQSFWGDINLDGYVDILDLINVVDHIVGRDSLSTVPDLGYTTSEFDRANIAPWPNGNPAPSPDAVVNVQDLSVIQWIILNAMYPNGDPLYKVLANLNKVGDASAKVTLFVTTKGIRAQLNSDIGIRGAQLEFGNVSGSTSGMTITTPLKGAFYLQQAAKLRVLMYDGMAEAFIPAGDNFLGNMPFSLETPKNITLDNIVLVTTETKKIPGVQVEFVYSSEVIPSDYSLSQNYPNPFNPTTSVEFSVPRKDNVTIKIYNMLGQEVRTLFTGAVEGGTYKVQWDGKNDAGAMVNSGAYVYRMTAADFQQSRKMTFLK